MIDLLLRPSRGGAGPGAPSAPRAPADTGGSAGASHPFALPSAMRARLIAAVKAGPVALIDLGSAKTACAIWEVDPRRAGEADGGGRVLGVGVTRSRGVEAGAVTDLREAEGSVRAAVTEAERQAGLRVYNAAASLSGAHPRSQAVGAEIAVAGPRVAPKDMAAAAAACRPPPDEEGRRVLDVAPVRWTVDGEPNIRAPLGFAGRSLGVDLHVVTVSEGAVRNLAHVLARADLEVAGLVLAPYASGLGVLTAEEREDGAAVIDLGAGATTAALFLRGAFVFADVLRLGGEHLTLDVVRAFGLSHAEAERLKTLEGGAVDLSAGAPPIDMSAIAPGYGEGGRLSRADLAAAIRPRIAETLSLARDRLAQAGFSYLPRRRVVLTGGGAELGGLLDAAQEIFRGAALRIGRPAPPAGAPSSLSAPAFAALCGLARHAAAPPAPLVIAPEAAPSAGGVAGLWRWLKESW